MKLAVFSDLHGHLYKDFDSISDLTGSERLDKIVETLVFIRDDCKRRGIDTVLFAGDMYHVRSKVHTVVFNSIYDTIKTFHKHGIQIIGIPGNHDQNDNSDVPQHSLHTFNDLPGVTIYGDLAMHHLDDDDIIIHCVPYSKNAQRTKEWIENSVKGFEKPYFLYENTKHICLFHLGIDGGFVGKGNYPMADAFKVEDLKPDFYQFVVGGHFHKHQFLGGYDHVFYTGAPIEHSFSDEGEEKGYFILDTDDSSIEFVPIPNPKFMTLSSVDVTYLDMEEIADAGHYVRIYSLERDYEGTKSFLPPHLKYKIILSREYQEITRVNVKIGMSDEEVVTNYAEKFNPDAMEVGLQILAEVKGGTGLV